MPVFDEFGKLWEAMMDRLSREDAALDRLWRDRFGAPLPMRGAGSAMKRTLQANGVEARAIEDALRFEPRIWL